VESVNMPHLFFDKRAICDVDMVFSFFVSNLYRNL